MKSLLITIVVATLYNALPEQTDDSPLVTASGAIINGLCPESHRWVAVSPDLLKRVGGSVNASEWRELEKWMVFGRSRM